jgi:hypothetical protein
LFSGGLPYSFIFHSTFHTVHLKKRTVYSTAGKMRPEFNIIGSTLIYPDAHEKQNSVFMFIVPDIIHFSYNPNFRSG